MVIPRGIEPLLPPWKGGVLTSWPRDQMAPPVGLEPTTLRLTAACSTDWAIEEYLRAYISYALVSALTNFPRSRRPSIVGAKELNYCVRNGNRWNLFAINTDSKRKMVTRTRLELVMPPWEGGVLTAWPTGPIGAPSGTRTQDPLIKSQLLYQLS